jgi:hypothetical protein
MATTTATDTAIARLAAARRDTTTTTTTTTTMTTLTMTMTIATVRWAMGYDKMAMTMLEDDDNNDVNGDSEMGNEVDDDGDG